MYRRALLALVLVLAVAVGGCVNIASTGGDSTTENPTTTAPQTTATQTTESPLNSCSPFLTVDRIPDAKTTSEYATVVFFENLTSDRQKLFEKAMDGEDLELETMDQWGEPKVVMYEGKRYRTAVYIC